MRSVNYSPRSSPWVLSVPPKLSASSKQALIAFVKTLAFTALIGGLVLVAAGAFKAGSPSAFQENFPVTPGGEVFLVPAASAVTFVPDELDIDSML